MGGDFTCTHVVIVEDAVHYFVYIFQELLPGVKSISYFIICGEKIVESFIASVRKGTGGVNQL